MDPFLGMIQAFGFGFAPQQWMLCDGAQLSIAQNTALFALLGTTYGGNGQTTFALPDLRGRTIVNQGNGPGLTPMTMGEVGGSRSVTLTLQNLGPHNHPVSIAVHSVTGEEPAPTGKIAMKAGGFNEDPTSGAFLSSAAPSSPAGSNAPIDISNPYLGVYHGIAVEGIFPSRN